MKKIKRDTADKLFNAALRLVKDNGHYDKAEAIMDYASAYDDFELSNYQFDFLAVVNFGGCEGIYIDCYLEGEYTEPADDRARRRIGTLKTLRTDITAMKIMGELAGALTYYADRYVNQNIDRYTPLSEFPVEEATP